MDLSRRPPLANQNIAHHESTQVWTASRCHRLLRPLLAHISVLRKEKARKAATENNATAPGTGTTATLACKRSNPGSATGQTEACKRRKICNKYSSKASRRASSQADASTPQRRQGDDERQHHRQRIGVNKAFQVVAMPTPFLQRVRNHQPSSPLSGMGDSGRGAMPRPEGGEASPRSPNRPGRPLSSLHNPFHLETELTALRRLTTRPAHSALHDSILRALESILRATCPRKTSVAAPRSLVGMCLRKVPEYISELEYWEKHDAEANGTKSVLNESKAALDVYSELESFGVVDGWKQLCVVVRAHSVRILEEAVREGLLEDEMTELAIRLCLEHMPEMELSSLIDSFIRRQYPGPSNDDDDLFESESTLWPLRIIRHYDTRSSNLALGKLALLLADGSLPATWILTKNFRSMWVATAKQMTKTTLDGCHRISDFFSITIELLCSQTSARSLKGASEEERREKERAQKMLTSGIAALASMVLLDQEAVETSETKITTLGKRVQHIVQTCINRIERARRATRRDIGIYLLRLCAFLSLDATKSASAGIEAAWHDTLSHKRHGETARLYDATLGLVGAVAHNCSRGTGLPPNDYFSKLCDKLATLNLPNDQLSNLRVDGAFYIAEHTGSLRDLAYAESLRAASRSSNPGSEAKTQAGAAHNEKPSAAFVWDDDIGEWVISKAVAVPALAPRRSTRSSPKRPVRRSLSLAECIANFQSNIGGGSTRPRSGSTGTASSWESDSGGDSSDPSEVSESGHSSEDDASDHVSEDDDQGVDMGEDNSSEDEHPVNDSDMDSYVNHWLPDTPATEVSPITRSSSPAPVKSSKRGVRDTLTTYLSLPARRSSMGFLSRRSLSNPSRQFLQETGVGDELAPQGHGDDARQENQPSATTRKRTRSAGGSLLCMKPVKKPGRAVEEGYDLGSSEDELGFI
ncbi:hypothetical protein QBC34DRAFT_388719 [Podospora aff. communis PSN243]|uniref:Wings apart-like protein C-terminal domain-containing protein n=1 Tax=Podospora aff. communis PSN243 TaxID=3040156 RepID=A0AAV9H682_9PEZI|nr:hypothetical protein QBC34DRAFT_388719 [Podospora aff. communis PSN243]